MSARNIGLTSLLAATYTSPATADSISLWDLLVTWHKPEETRVDHPRWVRNGTNNTASHKPILVDIEVEWIDEIKGYLEDPFGPSWTVGFTPLKVRSWMVPMSGVLTAPPGKYHILVRTTQKSRKGVEAWESYVFYGTADRNYEKTTDYSVQMKVNPDHYTGGPVNW